jgi:hypothetical protein
MKNLDKAFIGDCQELVHCLSGGRLFARLIARTRESSNSETLTDRTIEMLTEDAKRRPTVNASLTAFFGFRKLHCQATQLRRRVGRKVSF